MNANTGNEKFALLSRFFDGEPISDAELEQLLADEEVAEKWQQYSLERAALRGECTDMVGMEGFAAKVAEAIESEPLDMSRTISRCASETESVKPAVDSTSEMLKQPAEVNDLAQIRRNKLKRVWAGLGHMAVAASVACVCVLGVSMYRGGNADFNEESFIGGGTSVSISPVSNTSDNNPISMQLNSKAQNPDVAVAALHVDKEQLRLNEERKARELRTLDALMNDHELMQRMTVESPNR